ncbi:unnamed protein product [Mesocestoides corti]|uniref:Uncharacterized protein n=1 Tax=Mesocestoides corti TaxID=53468 RepID=A0A158QTU2_MESCO|nr:unnamed protein product [Mesocestoides corti]
MHWISDQDISRDLLLVLHTDSKLTLWNAQTCTPLWKKTYSSNLTSVSLDPFSSQNLICEFAFSNLHHTSACYAYFRYQQYRNLYVTVNIKPIFLYFLKVYCCRQADALVCLHQNGTVNKATPSAPVDLNYRLMCESKSLRRGRNFHVVAMAVDPSTELTITVSQPTFSQFNSIYTFSPSFSLNIHRACLLASHKYVCELESAASVAAAAAAEGDSESLSTAKMNYTSSVKLLAASLISSNRLYEGVEMLCMLGMHSEACRYLEAYNEWGTAVWLAKVRVCVRPFFFHSSVLSHKHLLCKHPPFKSFLLVYAEQRRVQ